MGFDLAAVQEFDVRVPRGKKPRERLEKALKYRQEALRYTQMQTGFSSEKISADESSSLQWPISLGSLAFGILSFLLPVYGKRLGGAAPWELVVYSPPSSRLQRYWSIPWSVGP
jgi:hypothetical protein